MKHQSLLPLVFVFVVSAAAGCDDDSSPGALTDAGAGGAGGADAALAACPTTGTGTLTLAITAPVALTPTIMAHGSTTPTKLTVGLAISVPAGPYTITATREKILPVAPALYVGKAYYPSATVFSGCVRNGMDSPVTVTYAEEPGSGKVWVTPSNGIAAVAAFDEGQLRAGGEQSATITRSMGITAARDLAFDPAGNLWVLDGGVGGGLLGYRMQTLGMPDRQPDLKLTPWEGIRAMAFDDAGNLWAVERVPGGTDRIVMLGVGMLGLGATSTGVTTMRAATATISLTSAQMVDPFDLAFDTAGNLWVASFELNQIIKFSAAQLTTGGAAVPVVILKAAKVSGPVQGALTGPTSIVFDTTGNLWGGWNAGGQLVRFTPANLIATGTINDPLMLEGAPLGGAGVAADPSAFDVTGGLWLPRSAIGVNAALVRIAAAGVTAGGTQATSPNMSSAGLGDGPGSIVLNPSPVGLPLRD